MKEKETMIREIGDITPHWKHYYVASILLLCPCMCNLVGRGRKLPQMPGSLYMQNFDIAYQTSNFTQFQQIVISGLVLTVVIYLQWYFLVGTCYRMFVSSSKLSFAVLTLHLDIVSLYDNKK